MALFKSTEGIIINATNSVSANYGSRTWHLTKDVPASGAVTLITITQTSSPTTRIPVNIQVFGTFQRKADPVTEIPLYVQHGTLFLNTNGNPTFDGDPYNQSGGNNIGRINYNSSGGTTATITGSEQYGATGEFVGIIITITTDQWNRMSISI